MKPEEEDKSPGLLPETTNCGSPQRGVMVVGGPVNPASATTLQSLVDQWRGFLRTRREAKAEVKVAAEVDVGAALG
jgi:hypothetical protein